MRLGVDLLDIDRFARIAAHPGGRRIVFSAREQAHADTLGEPRRTEYLAGRFCAKEAAAKALGRGFGQGLVWRDIEVLADAHGAPVVCLSAGAADVAEQAGVAGIALTLSHHGGLVVCVAVAMPAVDVPCDPACRRLPHPEPDLEHAVARTAAHATAHRPDPTHAPPDGPARPPALDDERNPGWN